MKNASTQSETILDASIDDPLQQQISIQNMLDAIKVNREEKTTFMENVSFNDEKTYSTRFQLDC